MKKFLSILLVFTLCCKLSGIFAQGDSYLNTSKFSLYQSSISKLNKKSGDNSMGSFALSLDPLGFLQFGPIVNAEFGLTDNLVLNTNVRISSLGALFWVINMDDGNFPDKLTGMGVGGGLKYFFGSRRFKPYLGAIFEYGWGSGLHDSGNSYEWEHKDRYLLFVVNGGYRLRFSSGFFINLGGYLGAAYLTRDEWYYTNANYVTDDPYDNGHSVKVYGMFDLAMGFEF